jgi:hypothetical protein
MIRRLLIVMTLVFALPVLMVAQAKPISLKDYWAPYHASVEKAKAVPYRLVIVDGDYKSGVLIRTRRAIVENLPPDRARTLQTFINQSGTISENEVITIGSTYYCRDEKRAKWKSSTSWCGDMMISGIPAEAESAFFVEDTQLGDEKVRKFTHKSEYESPDYMKVKGRSYHQNVCWINSKGLVIKRKITRGLSGSDESRSITTEVYDYAPKELKLDAPIK